MKAGLVRGPRYICSYNMDTISYQKILYFFGYCHVALLVRVAPAIRVIHLGIRSIVAGAEVAVGHSDQGGSEVEGEHRILRDRA